MPINSAILWKGLAKAVAGADDKDPINIIVEYSCGSDVPGLFLFWTGYFSMQPYVREGFGISSPNAAKENEEVIARIPGALS